MVLTITVIALFQAYWLRKNYLEENRLLTLRTQLLFRETLFKLQAAKLHLDTSFSFRMPDPAAAGAGALNMASVVQKRLFLDSTGHARKDEVFISVAGRAGGPPPPDDSAHHTVFYRTSAKVTQFLSGIDSLQDSVTVKEIDAKFRQVLAREGIRASFTITVTPLQKKKDASPIITTDDNVILGFSNPRSYSIQLENTFWLTARRLGPQMLFSLLLVGITIFSFLLLYRNWRQQQKLTILKNDFISNITHELKTPIATVSVAVEALKEFDALKDPVRTKEYLEISAHELQRLSLLVDKVLKLSLFERQEIQLKKDEFDMKALIEDVMASMRLQFEKHQAKVRLTAGLAESGPGKDKFFLRGDKLHFTSVIYNLLDNALKYTKTIPRLLIDLHGEQDFLLLTVTDNGIGIPADYKDRIFEKFFRVPTGDHHNVKGYGLGLSYVAYVVQRHGGEISVRSEEGMGSQFKIKIPRGYA